MEEPKTLNITQLSAYLGIKKRTMFYMIKSGRFDVPYIRGFNTKRWNVEDVDRWRFKNAQK